MKALNTNRAAQKAAKSEFKKYAIDYVTHTAQGILAVVMHQMYSKWQCSPATCRKRLDDVITILNAPSILGKEINDYDCIKWCRDTLKIDLEKDVKLKVKIEYV